MVTRTDFKRELPCYRARRDRPQILDVPDLQYLMIDGRGDPNTAVYGAAVSALYPLAYTLRAAGRSELGLDHVVMPLEGLWWADDMAAFTTARDKSRWSWTLMIMMPGWVTAEMLAAAAARLRSRTPPERLDDVRLERLSEGRCVQVLHVGPFDAEGEVLRYLHEEFIPGHGLVVSGTHHEIYLSDPRRARPERLRTILRQPVTDGAAAPRATGAPGRAAPRSGSDAR